MGTGAGLGSEKGISGVGVRNIVIDGDCSRIWRAKRLSYIIDETELAVAEVVTAIIIL